MVSTRATTSLSCDSKFFFASLFHKSCDMSLQKIHAELSHTSSSSFQMELIMFSRTFFASTKLVHLQIQRECHECVVTFDWGWDECRYIENELKRVKLRVQEVIPIHLDSKSLSNPLHSTAVTQILRI